MPSTPTPPIFTLQIFLDFPFFPIKIFFAFGLFLFHFFQSDSGRMSKFLQGPVASLKYAIMW